MIILTEGVDLRRLHQEPTMFTPHDILLSMALTLGFAVCTLLAALLWKHRHKRHGHRPAARE